MTPGHDTQPRPARQSWLLPEDGITDEIAIEIAASGKRPVALTPAERRLAAALILARGGTAWQVAKRLHMNYSTAKTLAVRLRAAEPADARQDAA